MAQEKQPKEVNIAVVLEKEDKKGATSWMPYVASEFGSKLTIQTTDTKAMNRFILRLKKEGNQIRNCALIGHGNEHSRHIGNLDNLDVNIDERIKNRDKCASEIEEINRRIQNIYSKLKEPKYSSQFEKLQERATQLKSHLESLQEQHKEFSGKVDELEGLSDAFASGAIISAINCCAGSKEEHEMMSNLGRVYLSKNGGSVIGFDKKIYLNPKQFEWEWLRVLTGANLLTVTWGNPVIVNIPKNSGPDFGKKVKKGGKGGSGGSGGAGGKFPEVRHPAKSTPCNGHNHKGNCHCGWGGTK